MVTVHHLENSRSQRILWLLEELGVTYEIRRYERDKKTSLAPPELLSIHPLGKSPVITDEDVTVAESGAIVEYLVGKYDDGTLLPAENTPERLSYTYWLHYAEGSLMPLMLLSLIVSRMESSPMPFFAKPIARGIAGKIRGGFLDPNVKRHLTFINGTLGKTRWLCGEQLTAADMQMSFPLEAAEVRSDLASEYPNLNSFLSRMRELPAYQAALEKGGPYQLLGRK
jgi:glutathione S-transferase